MLRSPRGITADNDMHAAAAVSSNHNINRDSCSHFNFFDNEQVVKQGKIATPKL
jgi:hypothetical protein